MEVSPKYVEYQDVSVHTAYTACVLFTVSPVCVYGHRSSVTLLLSEQYRFCLCRGNHLLPVWVFVASFFKALKNSFMSSLPVYGDMLDTHRVIRKHGWEGWAHRWQLAIDTPVCKLQRKQTLLLQGSRRKQADSLRTHVLSPAFNLLCWGQGVICCCIWDHYVNKTWR